MIFGTYRYLLAHFVVLGHLYGWLCSWCGIYSVFGFYVLSGFLMTFILNENYGFHGRGIGKYLFNRALRIYPAYYLVLALTALLIFYFPDTARGYNPHWFFPEKLSELVHNFTIVGLGSFFSVSLDASRIVEVAWALHLELVFYLVIPFLARNVRSTALWCGAGLCYTAYLIIVQAPWEHRYHALQSVSLPFSLGAAAYYLLHRVEWGKNLPFSPKLLVLSLVLCFTNMVIAPLYGHPFMTGFYINLFLQFFVVCMLSKIPKNALPGSLKRIDRFLGELSYPVYLIHLTIAGAIIIVVGRFPNPQSPKLIIAAVPLINIASFLIVRFLDKRMKPLRNRVRGKSVESFQDEAEPGSSRSLA